MPLVNIQDKFVVSVAGGVSAPSNPSITNKTTTGFTASWGAVAGALGYRLDIATDSGFTSFVSGYNSKAVAGTSEAVTGLSPNTTYYVRVRTVATSTDSIVTSDTTQTATLPLNAGLRNGLYAFYKLDDTTDASGNGNNLTNNDGVTFGSGKIGNAASFDGNSLSIPNIQHGNTFSVTCWAKWLQESHASLVAQYPGCWMAIYGNGSIELSDLASYGAYSNSGLVTTGVWNHYALVVTNGYAKVYLNGSLVFEDNDHQMNLDSNSGRGFGIGGEAQYNRIGQTEIDAFGVWTRALTESEVAELYNSGNGLE